jgi:hypothetical protein
LQALLRQIDLEQEPVADVGASIDHGAHIVLGHDSEG